jgi:RHS repeat-associated protein
MSRSLRAAVVVLIAALVAVGVSLVGGALADAGAPAPARSVEGSPPPLPSAEDEIASERTAYARTYRQPGGGRKTLIYAAPVNYQDSDGTWKPIDTRLVSPAGATVAETVASPVDVSVPQELGDGAVKVNDAGRWVSFGLTGASASASITGSTASYADAVDTTDASLTATATGVKETLTIQDAQAPATYRYELSSSAGLTASLQGDGSVAVVDAQGTPRFSIPAPTVQEAGGRPTTDHVHYDLSADGTRLTVAVDPAWLGQAQLPVEVDPSVNTSGVTTCTLASAGGGGCNGTSLQLGHSTSGTSRIALRLSSMGGIPQTAAIVDAAVGLRLQSQTASGATPDVDVRRLSRTITSSATWTKYDATNSWTTAGGDTTGTFDRSQIRTSWVGSSSEFAYFDISPIAEQWVRGDTNRGLLLQLKDETLNDVLTFAGTGGTSGNLPFVAIDWQRHPGHERDKTYETQRLSDNTNVSVDVANGNLSSTSQNLHVNGVAGHNLDFAVTYNGTDDLSRRRAVAEHWTLSIAGASLSLERNYPNDGRVLRLGDGTSYRFDRDPASDSSGHAAYRTPSGIEADMDTDTATGKTTITWRRSGAKWKYNEFFPGDLESVTDDHGNTWKTFQTTVAPGEVEPTEIRNTAGTTVATLAYDTNGALTRITDTATGRHWDYGQSSTSSPWTLNTITNPDGKIVHYYYTSGKLSKITDARGHDTTFTYGTGTDGNASQVTAITRVVDGTTTNDITTTFNYLPTGTAPCATGYTGWTIETTPEPHAGTNKTKYCWITDGQVSDAYDALDRKQARTYSATGNVATFTGLAGTANSTLTTYTFSADAKDNPTGTTTKATSASNETTSIKYCDDTSQPTCSSQSADPLYKYRPTLSTDEQGDSQAYKYGSGGSSLSTNPGDVTEIISQSGGDHQYLGYDSYGDVTSVKDGNANTTTLHYNASQELDAVTPPAPLVAQSFTYDAARRIASATDGNAMTAIPTYDGQDRVTRVDFKNAAGITRKWMTFAYDDSGNLTQRADSDGNTTTYTYDNLNRRDSETLPGARTNCYAYDKNGNLISVADGSGTTSYTYDEINRLKTIVSPNPAGGTETISYAYGDTGGPTGSPVWRTATFPGGLVHEVDSDLAGNDIIDVIKTTGATPVERWKETHTFTNGTGTSTLLQTSTDLAGKTTTYSYGPVDRLTEAKTVQSGSTTEDWNYTYDSAGNRLTATRTAGGATTTTTSAYNAANQPCWNYTGTSTAACGSPPAGATSYSYDGAGDRLSGGSTATWDAYPRLTTLGGINVFNLAPGNGELTGYGTTEFQNNLLGVGREIPNSGASTAYTRQPDGTLVAQRTNSTKQSIFTNRLGSTIAVTDHANNTLDRTYTYDPYGTTSTTGTGATTDILYAGGLTIGGLDHFGARYYDPTTATWTQPDPINHLSSLAQANHYTYVGGNPTNSTDPTGLVSCATFGVGGLCRTAKKAYHSEEFWGHAVAVTTVGVTCMAGAATVVGISVCMGAASLEGSALYIDVSDDNNKYGR